MLSEKELTIISELATAQEKARIKKVENLRNVYNGLLEKFKSYKGLFENIREMYMRLNKIQTNGKIREIFNNHGYWTCCESDIDKKLREGSAGYALCLYYYSNDIVFELRRKSKFISTIFRISQDREFGYFNDYSVRTDKQGESLLKAIEDLNFFLSIVNDIDYQYREILTEIESYTINLQAGL